MLSPIGDIVDAERSLREACESLSHFAQTSYVGNTPATKAEQIREDLFDVITRELPSLIKAHIQEYPSE